MEKKSYFVKTLIFMLICFCTTVSAQRVFKGKVYDGNENNTLPGATVRVLGTTVGTATNNNGEFTLEKIPEGDITIKASFAGYKSVTVSIKADIKEKEIDFTLTSSPIGLDEVTVTGTGTHYSFANAPVQTEVISNKVLSQISPSTFEDAMLSLSPSFDNEPSIMGEFTKINGLANATLFLIDGKRITGGIGDNVDQSRINPDNIERIEIVKGSSSSLYGSEAMAGVINIITKKHKNRTHLESISRVEEYGKLNQYNSVSLNIGKLASNTTYNYKKQGGYQLSPYEVDTEDDQYGEDSLVYSPTAKMNVYKSDDHKITQSITYDITDKLDIYADGSWYQKDKSKPEDASSGYSYRYQDLIYGAGAKYRFSDQNSIQLKYNKNRYRYSYIYEENYNDIFEEGDVQERHQQGRQDINLKTVLKLNSKNRLTAGVDHIRETYSSSYYQVESDISSVELYAQDEIDLAKDLTVVAGARYIHHEKFGSNLTPKISATYKINNVKLRGNYALGYKAPAPKKYSDYEYSRTDYQSTTLYIGNPDLKPQTSEYYNVAVEYTTNWLNSSISIYRTNIEDLISYSSVPITEEQEEAGFKKVKQYDNIGEAGNRGVDLLFNAYLGQGFTIGGGYSYIDAKDRSTDLSLEGVANNYFNARFNWKQDWSNYGLNINLTGRIQGGKYYNPEDNYGVDYTDSYNLWKLSSMHTFKPVGNFRFSATAGVNNIFDYTDNSPYGYEHSTLTPGRSLFASIKIQFTK